MGKHKEKSKKHKREKKHKEKKKHRRRKSSSSSASTEEWVEKETYSSSEDECKAKEDTSKSTDFKSETKDATVGSERGEWMSLPTSFLTESNLQRRKNREENRRLEKERAQYNPRESVRELNPHWKDGGDGLPKFKKPSEETDTKYKAGYNRPAHVSSWRKKPNTETNSNSSSSSKSEDISNEQTSEVLSDKEMNILASKLVKAEIMGKTELIKELKEKLEIARKMRGNVQIPRKSEEVLLTTTDSRGHTRPLKSHSDYGEHSDSQRKKKKVETHQDGQRVRYFADDDKHSLQQMFENERYNTAYDQDNDFVRMAGKVRKNDDVDDIFTDDIRKEESGQKTDERNKNKAIKDHQRVTQSMDNCRFCLQSNAMSKHLMITLRETCFLSLPSHEPLTEGHCLIVPIRHVSCSTLLDENEWSEIMDFRKILTRMFLSNNQDIIFFETAKNLDKYPHMYLECIPVDKEEGDMAPIYFKKAIDECEVEWAQNKKLVSLKNRDVRRAVPKGLPYFFVSFGMDEGYAHVIEDARYFPNNFAQEVIGGMLDLHHSKWRKPKQQTFDEQSKRVVDFSKQWDLYDDKKT